MAAVRNNIRVLVTSAPRHKPTLCECLASINYPAIVLYDAHQKGALTNFVAAVGVGLRTGHATHYLVLQDDAVAVPNCVEILQKSALPEGWLLPWCQGGQDLQQDGWGRPYRTNKPGGAVAYLVPHDLAVAYVCEPPSTDHGHGTDYESMEWCAARDVPVWIHRPSLFQHVGEYRAIGYDEANGLLQHKPERTPGRWASRLAGG
jgi:hypothetical protein